MACRQHHHHIRNHLIAFSLPPAASFDFATTSSPTACHQQHHRICARFKNYSQATSAVIFSRMTMLFGPQSSTLLLALAGKLNKKLRVCAYLSTTCFRCRTFKSSTRHTFTVRWLEEDKPTSDASEELFVPFIDLKAFLFDDPNAASEVSKQVHVACKTLGFFQVVNHGISFELLSEADECVQKFFYMSLSDKQRAQRKSVWKFQWKKQSLHNSGYTTMGSII